MSYISSLSERKLTPEELVALQESRRRFQRIKIKETAKKAKIVGWVTKEQARKLPKVKEVKGPVEVRGPTELRGLEQGDLVPVVEIQGNIAVPDEVTDLVNILGGEQQAKAEVNKSLQIAVSTGQITAQQGAIARQQAFQMLTGKMMRYAEYLPFALLGLIALLMMRR